MTGTTIKDKIIRIAPILIGDARFSGREAADFVRAGNQPNPNRIMCPIVPPTPRMKLVQTAGTVTFLLYRPKTNGPQKEPASAPQE